MKHPDTETIKGVITSYIYNTDNWDPDDVADSLARLLIGIIGSDLENTQRLIKDVLDQTIDDIIVETYYPPDNSHPTIEEAIEICFESETEQLADNILKAIEKQRRGSMQQEIKHTEIDIAYEHFDSGHLREAGMIAGVILEKHLAKTCKSKSITVDKKNPTLSDWNAALKKNNIYDKPVWRGIQRYTDIRNICAHPTGREPTMEEIRELIEGVNKITKTIS